MLLMIGERGAKLNSAEWPARRHTQWMSGVRPFAAPACVVSAHRFVCPLAPLAEDVGEPPGSALLTQTTPNASVF
ncbi:hypothetical protein GON15_29140 [Burkholderia contaminans]|uniref:Uncharacterized protein n=2 Tax=Burkholderia contaminans TaxID=488447 RepID=A0ABS3PC12_9BURK|nr:hypothetical protein WR31_22475 [Burkholderia contaminans LMG 23361]MBH9690302.1 hypothetical protein [Burkholderia contaminans]MBK1900816.1 hypothetical protein [Burkholderia contaminans]MBK1923185.1 hypothetical protein [Burkholderia contaminans]MBK1937200.1 hypothetical protein [Burkholderia contaminans]